MSNKVLLISLVVLVGSLTICLKDFSLNTSFSGRLSELKLLRWLANNERLKLAVRLYIYIYPRMQCKLRECNIKCGIVIQSAESQRNTFFWLIVNNSSENSRTLHFLKAFEVQYPQVSSTRSDVFLNDRIIASWFWRGLNICTYQIKDIMRAILWEYGYPYKNKLIITLHFTTVIEPWISIMKALIQCIYYFKSKIKGSNF